MDLHRRGTVKLLSAASRSHMADVLLTLYFMGACVSSGIAGLIQADEVRGAYGSLLTDLAGFDVAVAYSWGMIVLGLAGVTARLFDSRQGELHAIIGISVFTILNGIILLPEYPATALRLMFAPAMMIPYAWMRRHFILTRTQVADAIRHDMEGEPGER